MLLTRNHTLDFELVMDSLKMGHMVGCKAGNHLIAGLLKMMKIKNH